MKIYTNQEQANFNVECAETEALKARMHRNRANFKIDCVLSNIGVVLTVIAQLIWAAAFIVWYLG